MTINQALLASAQSLREPLYQGEEIEVASLRKAFADYAEAYARRNAEEDDVMAGVALIVAVSAIGIASGFSNGDPNPRAVQATLETINEIASEMMVDFVGFMRRNAGGEARH